MSAGLTASPSQPNSSYQESLMFNRIIQIIVAFFTALFRKDAWIQDAPDDYIEAEFILDAKEGKTPFKASPRCHTVAYKTGKPKIVRFESRNGNWMSGHVVNIIGGCDHLTLIRVRRRGHRRSATFIRELRSLH